MSDENSTTIVMDKAERTVSEVIAKHVARRLGK